MRTHLRDIFEKHVFPAFVKDDQPFIDAKDVIGNFGDGEVIKKYFTAYQTLKDRGDKTKINTEVRNTADSKDANELVKLLKAIVTGAWKPA